MELFLDELLISTDATTVAGAIEHGARAAEESGRCVVEVYLDGRRAADVDSAVTEPAQQVRLVTAEPRAVVHDALHDTMTMLDHIATLQQEAAEFIQADQIVDAMEMLEESIEAWMQVQEAVVKCAAFANVDLDSLATDQVAAATAIEQLENQLRTMIESLRTGDTILLADTLLYELPQTILDWKHLLTAIIDEVADGIKTP